MRPIETADRLKLRELLDGGLEQGHIWPAFQPIVSIRTGAIAGFEVLARRGDPQAGDISPAIFIPRLEHHGLIGKLSDALIDKACRAAANWPGSFSLAFNISPLQLTSADFPRHLAELVSATSFPLTRVDLEVTEGSLISDDDLALTILRDIDGLGMRVSIDDFGTGHSSLARLEAFPFQKLKIDARFVHGLGDDAGKRRIAAAVIGLGQSLGMTVVAEGVESDEEAAILQELGCQQGQGWLYSKAVPAEQAKRLLETRGTEVAAEPLDTSPFQRMHQLATLYDQVPIGLCFLDTNHRYVRVNERFARIHGLTPEELEGRTIDEVMHGELLETVVDILNDVKSRDEPITHETILQGRSCMVMHSRVTDIAGEDIGFSVLTIDVTEETRLREALAGSERRLQRELDFVEAIFRSLPGIFYYYDHEMRLKRWNTAHERVAGYSDAELQDADPLVFFVEEERQQISDAMQEVFTLGQSQTEAHLLTKDGKRIPYLFTGVRFEHEGRTGLVGSGQDISESKRVEQALRENAAILEAVIENSSDGLLLVDPDRNRIIQNRRFNEIWNIPPELAAGPHDRSQFDHVTAQVRNRDVFVARVVWLETHPDETSSETIERLDGSLIQRHTAPLYDSDGCYRGRIWSFREIAPVENNT
ncbi:EAL domain-containing protein [Aquamicrobium lusatiense]|uniref:EAL domain-containing protein n=1 Tax=Aquamicrobium lusatiense TaxID=89772 RepID=UPI0024562DC7|nr:EAL domain-containing protein [Aquamicrobium lusatiense]MDH4992338.1 EAL domain-containing protein [Aquamicrobium lusatiense]